MSLIDVLDKLEKLEIISNSDNWIKFRQLRNQLSDQYPENMTDTIDGIKLAIDYFDVIKNDLIRIQEYMNDKKLIDYKN